MNVGKPRRNKFYVRLALMTATNVRSSTNQAVTTSLHRALMRLVSCLYGTRDCTYFPSYSEHSMFRAPWPIHCAGACLLPVLLSTLIRVPKPNSIHKLIPGAAAHAVAYQRSR